VKNNAHAIEKWAESSVSAYIIKAYNYFSGSKKKSKLLTPKHKSI